MDIPLLELPANKLLDMFGAGEHKPGSGSAAALQGMLAAQLICTVISLTIDPKRRHYYRSQIDDLENANSKIKDKIYPQLADLFREDSAQFDKIIKLRRIRDAEKNDTTKKKLSEEALEELIPATEMPIKIAELCIELSGFALLIFDYGFKSARGDSGVALSSAVSAIAGCLSIIPLNLISFTTNEWASSVISRTETLRTKYDHLSCETSKRIDRLRLEANDNIEFYQEIRIFKDIRKTRSVASNLEIENIAIDLQRFIWKNRDKIFRKDVPQNPLDILNPEIVIKTIGYEFTADLPLGQHTVNGKIFEVAGLIDNQSKKISISTQFPITTQRFTAAHELGHALLHEQSILHRDRALDGSLNLPVRDKTEFQADKFSTYFLMPKKQVVKIFSSIFLTNKFQLSEITSFALSVDGSDITEECSNLRALSRILAATEYYNGKPFPSLSKQFNVSIEAMAIRLEELRLLEF